MYTFKSICSGEGGVRALVALVGDPDLVPSVHTVAHNPLSPVLWGLMAPGMHMVVHRHTQNKNSKSKRGFVQSISNQTHLSYIREVFPHKDIDLVY